MTYTVFIEENSRYQDPEGRYKHGEFGTFEEAAAACRTIVDEFLASAFKPGMDAEELFRSWSMFGEDPFIVPKEGDGFSGMDYARQRCRELCLESKG